MARRTPREGPRRPVEADDTPDMVSGARGTTTPASDAPSGLADPMATSDLRRVAVSALVQVADDEASPASARAQAARSILEMIGLLGPRAVTPRSDKPISEMTAAELDVELDRLSRL